MYITKTHPDVSQNGVASTRVSIQKNVLIIDDEEKYKYEDGKWYCGTGGDWCYLGVLANPCHSIKEEEIISQDLVEKVFDKVEDIEKTMEVLL